MRLTTSFIFAIFVCGVIISANLNFANAVTFKDYDDAVTAGKKLVVKGAPRGDGEDLDALLFKPVNGWPLSGAHCASWGRRYFSLSALVGERNLKAWICGTFY